MIRNSLAKTLILASAAIGGAAFANVPLSIQGELPDLTQPAPGSWLTRADVHAEVLKARAAGMLPVQVEIVDGPQMAPSHVQTRAEVQAEVLKARAAGMLPLQGEILEVAQPASSRARARAVV